MERTAIIFCTYDGILSQYCGVGTISKSFVHCLSFIGKQFPGKFDFHVISPLLNETCLGFDKDLFDKNKKIIEGCGGEIHFVMNGSNGFEQYGTIEHRKLLSVGTAGKIMELAKKYDKLICIYTDTPFLQVPYYVNIQQFQKKNIKHYLYMHSDTFVHEKTSPNIERLSWETGAVSYANFVDNLYIINTNPFFKKNLLQHYCFPEEKLIDLKNGINLLDEKYKVLSQDAIEKKLLDYGIPINKNILFSFGRAVPYKGFETLIKSFYELQKQDVHLVIIAAPYVPNGGNVTILKKMFSDYGIKNYTAIYDVDFVLPSFLCQWKNTRAVLQLSLAEPFGLIPEEVRMWAKDQGPICICSNVDGYRDQISNGVDGFLVNPVDSKEIVRVLEKVLYMDDKELSLMRKHGYNRLLKEFNLIDNLSGFLKRNNII